MQNDIAVLQNSIYGWLLETFGEDLANDPAERNHRFIEEALELVQANGMSRMEVEQFVHYVFSRPKGRVYKEVADTYIALSALASAASISTADATHVTMINNQFSIEKIREKRKEKPEVAVPNENGPAFLARNFVVGEHVMMRDLLKRIAECESYHPKDTVALARTMLANTTELSREQQANS